MQDHRVLECLARQARLVAVLSVLIASALVTAAGLLPATVLPAGFLPAGLTPGGFILASLVPAARAEAPCGPWDLVPTPDVGNSVTRLTAVTALSADDAWAVGYWRNEPAGSGPLAIRWNGAAWSETSLPPTGHLGTSPVVSGVEATPGGDVWAAGNVTTTYPSYFVPLVLRWRSGDWDFVDTVTLRPQTEYPYADRAGAAVEVDALSDDDVWAVGYAGGFGDGAASTVPLAIHWDGSSWTEVDVPRIANRHHELNDVVMISADDVWAVGDYRNIAGTFRGITYHWDGSSWSHVPSPIEEIHQSGLEDVAATGPNDVWAIGGSDADGVLLQHWNGSQWSLVTPPPNSGGSLAAVAPNDLWASGWNGFFHWDGVEWTEVPASVPGATYVIRSGGMEIVGGCDIWCVGFWTEADGITGGTLAERLRQPSASVEADGGIDGGPPRRPGLAFQNPFGPGGSIRLEMPAALAGTAQPAVLTVRDLGGRQVRRLFESATSLDGETIAWDGRTDAGAPLPAGLYFLDLEAGGARTSEKLLLLGER